VADKAVLIGVFFFFRFANRRQCTHMSSLPRDNKQHAVRSEIISDAHEREIYNQKVFHLSLHVLITSTSTVRELYEACA
jgi:hypothetical protein